MYLLKKYLSFLIQAALCLGLVPCAYADVKLPAIFGDHMVLQQEATLPVWGWASPGEKIVVSFGNQKANTTTGADGKWRVDLAPVPAGTAPGTLVVAGRNTITLSDVLVGDVWLCSGQSNMEFPTKKLSLNQVSPTDASDNQIRLFHIPHRLAIVPLEDVTASWEVCSPETLSDFTAVGFFFAKNLRPVLNRPIGLIESSWGATTAHAWTSMDGLQTNPVFQPFIDDHNKSVANYPGGETEFETTVASYDATLKQWNDSLATNAPYQEAYKAWQKASNEARAASLPQPPAPATPTPQPHFPPGGHHNAPAALFDAMINPIIPYAIKGVIWYQGEDDSKSLESATNYRISLPALITDWRTHWKEGDFPFLFVQLAGFTANPKDAGEASTWAIVRESQLKTLALPNTGMAVAVDIGTVGNIHPPDKADVGLRLSLAAQHVAYGKNLVYTGPIYDSFQITGNTIRISFKPDSIGGGLTIGKSPCADPTAAPISTTDLQGFAIAGADQKWFWATAKIDQNTIVVSSPDVSKPVAVRYAWAFNPTCNLYNKEGLPASPFRTDDWEVPPADAAKAAALFR
jgi:sialate O-acetylesterase